MTEDMVSSLPGRIIKHDITCASGSRVVPTGQPNTKWAGRYYVTATHGVTSLFIILKH